MRSMRLLAAMLVLMAWAAMRASALQEPPTAAASAPQEQRILVFSKTAGFRHDSIPAGIEMLRTLGRDHGLHVDATEDAAAFSDAGLKRYGVVVFLNTTGDVLDESQQAAFERFIRSGRGFVGVHSAADTEYDWAWYTKLIAAQFASHPEIQQATVRVVDGTHASTSHLPESWTRADEWYNFREHPSKRAGGRLGVLARVDEQTYVGGSMGADHPVAWKQEFDGGRAWYTAMGHTIESYSEPEFMKHVLGGVQWAMGDEPR